VSGRTIRDLLVAAGHHVTGYDVVRDERTAIRQAVTAALERPGSDALIVSGGTGVAPRDVTLESLEDLWTKRLPGFGELFRVLSHGEIGPAAFLSRAAAGVVAGRFVAVLPGSPAACRLAMERLILPELGHIADLLAPPR
jgi:molybdenum cofactor biosynthesis protein B